MTHITNDQAERVVSAAKLKAKELGVAASIFVQDHSGHPVVFTRMDGAFLGSIDIAEKKARTSVYFKYETQQIWQLAKPDAEAHGVELTNGMLVTFAGGIPLFRDGSELIGAIGVSGGSVAQDYAIAQAGRDALSLTSKK